MSNKTNRRPTAAKPANSNQRPRNSRAPDNDLPQSDAEDESGNRALHSVATGPNPNVGRDDIERPGHGREGGVEST
jgi:hypothetical protein